MVKTPTHSRLKVTRGRTLGKHCPNKAVALVAVLMAGTAAAQPEYGPAAPVSPAQLEAAKIELKAEIEAANKKHADELDAVKKELAKEREARALDQANAAKRDEETRRTVDKAMVIRAGRFGLSLSGFLHADVVAWRESSQNEINAATGQPLNETRFLIRRARLKVEMDYGIVGGVLEFDGNTVNGTTARIIAGEVSLRWKKYIGVTVGLFKMTYGFEIMQQSDKERLFLERSNAMRALFPGEYDLGVKVQGGWRFLRYAVAVMNGNPAGDKQFALRDPNDSKDVLGRLGVETKIHGPASMAGGFSALWGTGLSKGQGATKDTLVWRDINENNIVDAGEVQAITGKPAVPSKGFQRWAVGGDLRFHFDIPKLGQLMLYGELVYGVNLDRGGVTPADPIAKGRDLRELGWYVGFTQELTKWAMVGLRYDTYNPDLDSDDLQNGIQVPRDSTFSTVAATAAFRYPGYARLILEYDHNTNGLGRTITGDPTTLGDDAFILRGEVQF